MSASGSQGSFPTHASHLRAPRLFEPKFLKGAQPSLVRNLRGPASLWHFRKSRVAETEGPEAIRKWGGGVLPQPRCQPVPSRDPSLPPRQGGRVPRWWASSWTGMGPGARQPGDRGTRRAARPGPFRPRASGNHFVQPPEAEIFFKKPKLFSVVR